MEAQGEGISDLAFFGLETPVRGIVLMSAAAVILFLASGCDARNEEGYPREQPQARAGAPRTNLYPLTSPPPGAGQAMPGRVPARMPAAYEDPNYARAGYGPGAGVVNITTPAPGGVNTYDAMNAGYAAPRYSTPTPASLSMAAGYGYDGGRTGLGPYDTSIYGSPTVVSAEAPMVRRSFGRVEGTADIVTSPATLGLPPPPAPPTGYAGGAYPTATATIPATYPPAPVPPPAAPVQVPPRAPAASQAAAAADMAAGFGQGEIRLVPAPDVPPGMHPNDAGPSQWFEIVRPGNGPLRIGRVSATCVCVGVRVPRRHIAAGERALVEARILTRPKVNNLTYGIYVNIAEPEQTVVDADVTVSL